MKVELAAKSRVRDKGRFTWTDFFHTILHGEGEVAVEFHTIDDDTNVNKHSIVFSLGNYCYEFKNGVFNPTTKNSTKEDKKLLTIKA